MSFLCCHPRHRVGDEERRFHASSPSTSGKTNEKPSYIQTRQQSVSVSWEPNLVVINQQKLVPRCFVSFTFRHRWASSLQCRVDPESVCSRLSALDNRQTIQGGKEKVFIRCFLTVSPKVCVPAIWMPETRKEEI